MAKKGGQLPIIKAETTPVLLPGKAGTTPYFPVGKKGSCTGFSFGGQVIKFMGELSSAKPPCVLRSGGLVHQFFSRAPGSR